MTFSLFYYRERLFTVILESVLMGHDDGITSLDWEPFHVEQNSKSSSYDSVRVHL